MLVTSRVIAILFPVWTVSVGLMYPYFLLLEHKILDLNGWTLFVYKTLYGEKYIYIVYIVYVFLAFQKIPVCVS